MGVDFSFKRTLSPTNWSTARGEPEKRRENEIMSIQTKNKRSFKPEKEKTWLGNDSWIQV